MRLQKQYVMVRWRWLQCFSGQRAWLDMWMCPMGLWMPSCNGILSGSGFGYIQKIHPWGKRTHVQCMHRWSDRWRVLGSCLWDMPNSIHESLCKHGWYPIFYSREHDLKPRWCTQWGKWSRLCIASRFQLWLRKLWSGGWVIAFGARGLHRAMCRCGVPGILV